MAIIPRVPGISVSIHLGDSPEPLAEYPDNDIDNKVSAYIRKRTTSCYIQSTPGTPFSFHLKIEPPYEINCPYLGVWFCVNDNDGDAEMYGPGHFNEEGILTDVLKGHAVVDEMGAMKMREFAFCELDVTDDDGHETLRQRHGSEREMQMHIGNLEVYIYRLKNGKVKTPEPTFQRPNIKEVHEKILKGQSVSCSVELGEEKEHEEPVEHQVPKYMDCVDKPVAVFKFKYRSKEDLQKELIIPRTPSPSPSPTPEPPTFDDLPEDEIRALAESAHGQRCVLRKIRARAEKVQYVEVIFANLTEEEIRDLARTQFSMMNGEFPPGDMLVRAEPSVKKERSERHRRARYSMKEMLASTGKGKGKEQGRVMIDLTLESDSDEEEDEEAAEEEPLEEIIPRIREKGVKRKQAQAEEEDEVVFLWDRPVEKSRKERNGEGPSRSRVKSEIPSVA
ncbi:hypothetical protein NHQ30_003202 [Ciborinia camelliae]|nr:hypothetical protein NHQ30_003202 [Ciborinia camelliae]